MAATTAAASAPEALSVPRSLRLWTPLLLAGLAAAFVVRLVLVWSRATPNYFPDEYLYAELARSLASVGTPEVRGHAEHFPALLQPLVTAPAWALGSVGGAYRAVQALGTAAITLAAVPVYLLARRLDLGRGAALVAATLALLVPDSVYAGFVVAEPLAYPLALAAVAAGVAALARPTLRAQVAFVGLAGLATFARAQLAVLPVAFVVAAAIVAACERRPRALREQLPVFGVLGAVAAAALVRGAGVLGSYSVVLHVQVHADAVAHALGRNALVLGYAAGWVLVPGALLGAWLALRRPRSRAELAFGALVAPLAAGLLLEASVFGEPNMAQERYLVYLVPLGAIAFALYAARGWPHRAAHALAAVALAAVAARVPLAGYAQPGSNDHSPMLWMVERLDLALRSTAGASLVVSLLAVVLLLAAAACSFRPRTGTLVAAGLAIAASAATLAGAASFDHLATTQSRSRYLPADPAWVDHAGIGPSTLVVAPGGRSPEAMQQLFWNRSIRAVAALPGALPPDRFTVARATIAAEGRILVDGSPVRTPILLDGFGSTARLAGATLVARGRDYTLWRPAGDARLGLYFAGRSRDGRLGRSGSLRIWPAGKRLAGWVELRLGAAKKPARLVLTQGRTRQVVRLQPGSPRVLRLRACDTGPWELSFVTTSAVEVSDNSVTSARASLPVFVPDAAACAS